jgi:hypothetical protein
MSPDLMKSAGTYYMMAKRDNYSRPVWRFINNANRRGQQEETI